MEKNDGLKTFACYGTKRQEWECVLRVRAHDKEEARKKAERNDYEGLDGDTHPVVDELVIGDVEEVE